MFGLGVGVSAGCFAEQARQATRRAAVKRRGDMRLLTGWRRIKRRKDEGTQMGPGVIGGDPQREGEVIAGLLRCNDRVYEAARPGELCVELMLVVGSHRAHRRGGLGGGAA